MATNIFLVLLGILFLLIGINNIKKYKYLDLPDPTKAKIFVGSIGMGIILTIWFSLKIFGLV